jgi:hypothetical protein
LFLIKKTNDRYVIKSFGILDGLIIFGTPAISNVKTVVIKNMSACGGRGNRMSGISFPLRRRTRDGMVLSIGSSGDAINKVFFLVEFERNGT